jgi:hypothetical protein
MLTIDPSSPIFKRRSRNQIRLLIFAAVAMVASLLYWEGRVAYYLFWDEGFLWYGIQRVMLGEVPIRDFMAYDPGRYYWSAAIMALMQDNSIIGARLAVALFQSVGLFFGLWVVIPPGSRANVTYTILAAIILGLWMYPNYKIFDSTISILLITTFAYLIDRPSGGRYFLAGFTIGIAACFGKNHGLYGAIAGLSLIIYLAVTHQSGSSIFKSLATWSLGIVIGYSPMLIMLLCVAGFANAFWERSVRILFEYGATNLSLPIPWPWLVDFTQPWFVTIRNGLIGLFFIAILGYGLLGLTILARLAVKKVQPLPTFVASVILALPYAHYAFSRADINHLALGIFPLLIGLLGLLMQSSTAVKSFGTVIFFIVTILTILPSHPGWMARAEGNWPVIKVAESVLIVNPGTAGAMKLITDLVDKYAPNGEEFIAAPFWPGAYAAFGRKSPTWEIYALFPRSKEFQEAEIERIKKTEIGFILINDYGLDSKEENRYRNTHPIIDQFIRSNYLPVETGIPNNALKIYSTQADKHIYD